MTTNLKEAAMNLQQAVHVYANAAREEILSNTNSSFMCLRVEITGRPTADLKITYQASDHPQSVEAGNPYSLIKQFIEQLNFAEAQNPVLLTYTGQAVTEREGIPVDPDTLF